MIWIGLELFLGPLPATLILLLLREPLQTRWLQLFGACMNRCLIHDEFYRWVVVLMGVVIIIIRMQ